MEKDTPATGTSNDFSSQMALLFKKLDDIDVKLSDKIEVMSTKLDGLSTSIESIKDDVNSNKQSIAAIRTRQTEHVLLLDSLRTDTDANKESIAGIDKSCEYVSAEYEKLKTFL